MNAECLPPGLYIVATPIGNLGDLSPRAADTLRRAALVLAEDKRVTAKLLKHAGAKTKLANYSDHTSEADRDTIVARLGEEAIALVSDAGTPLISDPGYKLVRAAREAGHSVHTVPGPSAVIAALTLAGLPTDRFLFAGFLPPKDKARRDALTDLAGIRATLVFYESGPRLADTLTAIRDVLGEREAAVIREISKLYEESVTGSVSELADRYENHPPKGEIVIVVGPPSRAGGGQRRRAGRCPEEGAQAALPFPRGGRGGDHPEGTEEARLRPGTRAFR
jgi:16S rRNA (cytidine1402-2'-O)-methyltransferase